jgi:hypothetical protein
LKNGAVSTLEAATTSATNIPSTQYALSVRGVLAKQQYISERRGENQKLEVLDENTCRECKKGDGPGVVWIGCDHQPRCFGGAGWYHLSCVGLEESDVPEEIWICKLCKEDDDQVLELEALLHEDDINSSSSRCMSSKQIIQSLAGTVSNNCTIINGNVLFLERPQSRSQEFIALGIRLHDNISRVEFRNGDNWEEYEGSIHDLNDDDEIRFLLSRAQVRRSISQTSRDILAQSTDARTVGCKRDTYRQQELPSWLASDLARPADVQKPHKKGIRVSQYVHPNAKVAPGPKRRRKNEISNTNKTALQFVSNTQNIKTDTQSTVVK